MDYSREEFGFEKESSARIAETWKRRTWIGLNPAIQEAELASFGALPATRRHGSTGR